ncbi:hypothetical protein GCM10027169_06510 [Gordonia jinhuaensis]|uniref:Heparin binding hemagglutinin HbhA n=1 Tax=Gordonia jinhuaensis TaxID=1517702 RepID=A0A916SYU9_9ACTN|nr:heparin-binding hemagglutinin [Gordonia jinhuaensis]GGB20760.1 hypothetical protein GCM10011489_06120 [Gordonia jinhuaensis]
MTNTDRIANPIYAAVGAGDLALSQVAGVLSTLRTRTESATEAASARLGETKSRIESLPEEVPAGIEELRTKLSPEEMKKVADAYLQVATSIYNALAERGEDALERFRAQPAFQEQLSRAEKAYNDVVDLTEDTLGTVSSQTRAVGERAAKLATRAAARSEEISNDLLEAGADAEEKANEAASKIAGAAGAVEGKARTAKDSPAKKMAAAHTTTTNGTAKTTRTSTTKSTPTKSTTTKSTTAKTTPAKSATKSTGAKDTTSTEE